MWSQQRQGNILSWSQRLTLPLQPVPGAPKDRQLHPDSTFNMSLVHSIWRTQISMASCAAATSLAAVDKNVMLLFLDTCVS